MAKTMTMRDGEYDDYKDAHKAAPGPVQVHPASVVPLFVTVHPPGSPDATPAAPMTRQIASLPAPRPRRMISTASRLGAGAQ